MRLRPFGLLAVSLLSVFAFASCSDDPTSPANSAANDSSAFEALATDFLGSSLTGEFNQREFGNHPGHGYGRQNRYPLELGNRWQYRRIASFETTLTDSPPELEVLRARIHQEIIGSETLFGREYVVEERVLDEGDFGLTTEWRRYRQDPSGLYEADVPTNRPPLLYGDGVARTVLATPQAPQPEQLPAQWQGVHPSLPLLTARADLARKFALLHRFRDEVGSKAALDSELTRLAYPLHTGQSWVLRDDPYISFTVEGLQVMRLRCGTFPAWRLRMDAEFFGEHDRAVFWIARVGFVGMAAQFEGAATDEDGNVIGVVRGREREVLTKFELQRHRRGDGER